MRLHVIGLPYSETTAAYLTCAFTQKVVRFCRMLAPRHEIVLYAGERNEAPCAEHVVVVTAAQREAWYGKPDFTQFYRVDWSVGARPWVEMNAAVIAALRPRFGPSDILCLIGGVCQQAVADAFPDRLSCEFGIGYDSMFAKFCCFESYAQMHKLYAKHGHQDGRYFDAVIPNFFDPDEFEFHVEPEKRDPYLLFVGRIVQRKGVQIAVDIAWRAGMKLKVAGQGVLEHRPGYIRAAEITLEGAHIEYVGHLGVQERSDLMGGATALLAPTTYIEPFGGVAVEAMLCGTPVVATDWGAFVETVTPSAGVRFRTLREGAAAVEKVKTLHRAGVRAHGMRYAMAAIAPRYEHWFESLLTVQNGNGWYA